MNTNESKLLHQIENENKENKHLELKRRKHKGWATFLLIFGIVWFLTSIVATLSPTEDQIAENSQMTIEGFLGSLILFVIPSFLGAYFLFKSAKKLKLQIDNKISLIGDLHEIIKNDKKNIQKPSEHKPSITHSENIKKKVYPKVNINCADCGTKISYLELEDKNNGFYDTKCPNCSAPYKLQDHFTGHLFLTQWVGYDHTYNCINCGDYYATTAGDITTKWSDNCPNK